jgi:hypothetical protein
LTWGLILLIRNLVVGWLRRTDVLTVAGFSGSDRKGLLACGWLVGFSESLSGSEMMFIGTEGWT